MQDVLLLVVAMQAAFFTLTTDAYPTQFQHVLNQESKSHSHSDAETTTYQLTEAHQKGIPYEDPIAGTHEWSWRPTIRAFKSKHLKLRSITL